MEKKNSKHFYVSLCRALLITFFLFSTWIFHEAEGLAEIKQHQLSSFSSTSSFFYLPWAFWWGFPCFAISLMFFELEINALILSYFWKPFRYSGKLFAFILYLQLYKVNVYVQSAFVTTQENDGWTVFRCVYINNCLFHPTLFPLPSNILLWSLLMFSGWRDSGWRA